MILTGEQITLLHQMVSGNWLKPTWPGSSRKALELVWAGRTRVLSPSADTWTSRFFHDTHFIDGAKSSSAPFDASIEEMVHPLYVSREETSTDRYQAFYSVWHLRWA